MYKSIGFIIVFFFCCTSSTDSNSEDISEKEVDRKKDKPSLPLSGIRLPEGFKIEIYAENIPDARSLALSPSGILFVGNRREDKVYALQDTDGDHKIDKQYILAKGLKMPCGVAFRKGDLYVAEVNRILKFEQIEAHLEDLPKPIVINDHFPNDKWHGWKFIAFGPDDKLYVPVGAPCNICERKNKMYSTIMRLDPDGSNLEIFAKGIRNSVGFDWHPNTKTLWFTDNGRDYLGDNLPSDELNHAPIIGMHFGFPYCHQGDISDPEFGKKHTCEEFEPPVKKLGAHVAALGMRFYTGKQFPSEYYMQIFIAQHGSWNRSSKVGYRIMVIKLEGNNVIEYKVFAEGWLINEEAWGRPVDLLWLPDGSMLVSDDYANVIYRISYEA